MTNRRVTIIAIFSFLVILLGLSLVVSTWQPQGTLMPTLAQLANPTNTVEARPDPIQDVVTLPIGEELIIQFSAETSETALQSVLTQLDARLSHALPDINGAVIIKDTPISQQQLAQLPPNVIIEPNYKVQSLLTYPTNDPMIFEQWSFATMDMSQWDAVETNTTIVAVIDSGACFDHPDLQGVYLDDGYDYVDDDTTPTDAMGHGCAVSGIIAANADNGIGIAGIAPNTRILPLRVLDADGIGTYADVISAIYEAVSSGADVINLSLGGQNHSQMLEQAVNYAVANGVQVVAGSGNTGAQGVFYPARYTSVIAVGSYGLDGRRSNFSTYGVEVDTLAPGEDILTTTINGNYSRFSGTSMAVPYVTGLLALSEASGQPVDLANILETPAPEENNDIYALEPTQPTFTPSPTAPNTDFSCNNITVHFRQPAFNDNHIEFDIVNNNYDPAYLLGTEVIWDKTPVQGDYPNIYLDNLEFAGNPYWDGEDYTSPTNTDSEGSLLFDFTQPTHPIYAPANSGVILAQAQFLNAPSTNMFDYFTTEDFVGTNFTFDHPNPNDDDCVVQVESYPDGICYDYSNRYILGTANSDLEADLRQAVECANASPAVSFIDLDGQTVTYSDAPAEYNAEGHNALQPIVSANIGSHLTITNGTIERDDTLPCDHTLEGLSSEFRFLYLHEDSYVVLENLTLRNGCASRDTTPTSSIDTFGGAIYSAGQLKINNSTLTNNNAAIASETRAGIGGAIYGKHGPIIITNSNLSGNVADTGGAIYADGTGIESLYIDLTISQSTVDDNSAIFAGGVYIIDSDLAVIDSTFSNNSATTASGGIHTELANDVSITNSTFYNNSAVNGFGALHVYSDSATITNSTFSNNPADNAEAIYVLDTALTLANTILANPVNSGSLCFSNISSSITNRFFVMNFLDKFTYMLQRC